MVQHLHRDFVVLYKMCRILLWCGRVVVLYKMYRILMVWSGNRRRPPLPKERPVGSREISYSTASLHPVGVMMILIEMMMVGVMMILIEVMMVCLMMILIEMMIVCLIQGVYKMISA